MPIGNLLVIVRLFINFEKLKWYTQVGLLAIMVGFGTIVVAGIGNYKPEILASVGILLVLCGCSTLPKRWDPTWK